MTDEFYSEHDYSEPSYSSSSEEEYDREYNRLAADIDEERFVTPHGDLSSDSEESLATERTTERTANHSSDENSDENSNTAHNGSSEEDRLDEPIDNSAEDDSIDDDPLEGYSIEDESINDDQLDDDSHNYSDISDPSEHEGHIRSHHRINRITMYSGEEDMFEYSDGDVRLPTRWHEGDERPGFPEPDMNHAIDPDMDPDMDSAMNPDMEATTDDSSEDNDESISDSEVDSEVDEPDDLPENILEYLDGITFENDCQKAKIVTDQCKYTLEENVKCFKCHVCGDTFSAEGISDNHSYHPKGKLPECPTCKTPIEMSVLTELFDKATVLEFIRTRFNERLSTPVFEAYVDTVKLLHENGYIDPDSDKKTIIDFLKELVKLRDSRERPIPLDISQQLYGRTQRMERFIDELLNAFNPELTDKRMRLMDALNGLPVKYGLASEPFKPKRELRKLSGEFIKSDTLIYHAPGSVNVYTYKVDSQIAEIEIREKVLRQSPHMDAALKGYVYSTGEFDPNRIPEIRKYIPEDINDYIVCDDWRSMNTVYSDYVNIVQTECIVMKKAYVLIPQAVSFLSAFRGSTEQRINAIQYYIEYARLLAEYIEIEPYRSNLLRTADELQTEYETWRQTYKRSINSPSDIIGMVYQMITENGSIDADFKASNYDRTYAIFKRSDVPIQVLIDATIDAMVPTATAAQRRIINEMLTKNEKANPFHRCPLRFLKSLTSMTDALCSCGGPILEHRCLLCGRDYCPHCHEPKGVYHSCDPVVLETIKTLDSTTVRCPKCATRIQKSEGCDHMFCVNCHCNFDWKTGKTIKESEQTNEMYENAMEGAEREYRYYMHRFVSYYENTKRDMLKPKAELLFYIACRNMGIQLSDVRLNKEISTRLNGSYNEKRYKDAYRALRPVIASTIENTVQILGGTVDDYQAEMVVKRIIGKGVDTLRLY